MTSRLNRLPSVPGGAARHQYTHRRDFPFASVRVTALMVSLAMVLVACQPDADEDLGQEDDSSSESPADEEAATTPTDDAGDTVVVALPDFSDEQFDPSLGGPSHAKYAGGMFDTLLAANQDGTYNLTHGALEGFEPNEDSSAYTLTLREGMTWHDGSPVTSEDVVFSFDHFRAEEAASVVTAALRDTIESIEIVDDLTVEVSLTATNVAFDHLLGPIEGNFTLLPKDYYETVGADGFENEPIGSGPWIFEERSIGDYVEYRANPDYWKQDALPAFERLRLLVVPERSTRIALLQRGDVDIAEIASEDVETLQADGFAIGGSTNVRQHSIVFPNSFRPEVLSHQAEFREALSLAIDVEQIIEAFYPGDTAERMVSGVFCPVCPRDESLDYYAHDPDRAREILDDIGYDGESIQYYLTSLTPEENDVGEAIAAQWEAVGLNVSLNPLDFPLYRERLVATPPDFGEQEIALHMHPIATRPSVTGNIRTFMGSHDAGGVVQGYWNPEQADEWVSELNQITDDELLEQRLMEIHNTMHEEFAHIPIASQDAVFALAPSIDADAWEPVPGRADNYAYHTLRPAG